MAKKTKATKKPKVARKTKVTKKPRATKKPKVAKQTRVAAKPMVVKKTRAAKTPKVAKITKPSEKPQVVESPQARNKYKGQKVLVVDNSRWIARLIKNQLTDIGFEVELISIATDGHQAYLILSLKEFDFVTSGLYLKAQNGLDMLIKVRTDPQERMRNIPFLVISAERTEGFIDDLAKARASGYLSKPLLNGELEQMVDLICNNPTGDFVRIHQQYQPSPILYDPSMDDIGIHPKVISGFIESAVEAFSQYLVTAIPGQPNPGNSANGDIVVSVDFIDAEHEVRVLLMIYFPLKIACDIYETIFGELNMARVNDVVQELGNIIGGIAKIKAAENPREFLKLTNGGLPVDPRKAIDMHFKMGLPEAWECKKKSMDLVGVPQFTIPLTINSENAYLQVFIQHA